MRNVKNALKTRQTRSRLAAARRATPAVIQPMERRVLMSAAVLSNGVLTVTGTAGADTISVKQQDPTDYTVNVNGVVQAFAVTKATPINSVVVNAGDGDDTVSVVEVVLDTGPTVSISGGAGDDSLSYHGEGIPATLDGGDGNDTITASSNNGVGVTMLGDAGNDSFEFQDEVGAVVNGGDGNDTLTIDGAGASMPVSFSGGAGIDTLNLASPVDATTINLDGKADSTITGNSGSTFGADIENVIVSAPDTTGYGAVVVNGDALDNNITVYANVSATVHGGDGNDLIDVIGGQNDAIYGDAGNDTIIGGMGIDGVNTISGGAGTDTVDYSAQTAGVSVYLDGSKLSGTAANVANGYGDQLDGTTEVAIGGSGNDLLVAAPGGGDQLDGDAGNDTLTAQGGADALFGGDGNDTFNAADGGATYIDGGAGTDTAYVDATGDTTINVENVIKPTPTPTQLTGTTTGTAGSYQNDGNTVAKATDGNVNTYFDGPTANGDTVVVDLGSAKAVTQIKYAPRSTYASRMVGGVFQASNSATFSSGVVNVYTITATPAVGVLTTVTPSTSTAYRYWRYVAPNGSYGNIAEFQLFGAATTAPTLTQRTGTTFGTAGSYQSNGNTVAKATDGSLSTYFDGPTASGDVVGLDLGSPLSVSQIRYAPRAGWAGRMVGGIFQASNTADFSSGVVNLYTVTATPVAGSLTTVTLSSPVTYRYFRYVAPANSYGNIAEFQLLG